MRDCYRAEVIARKTVTPSMIRLEIGGGDLDRFRSSGFADEWVRLVFPAENGSLTLPHLIDGRWQMPDGQPRSSLRPYTIRRWNEAQASVTVDFVAHAGGVAAEWAMNAAPGDPIGVTSPQGKYAPPADTHWILLLADITGLPAIGRILDEAPADRRIQVHIEIPDAADIQHNLAGNRDVCWHYGFDRRPETTRLAAIARAIPLPPGPGYIWAAGEAKETTAIRRYFNEERNVAKENITAIGYWLRGKPRD